jgi:DNA-binding transcriptional MerR regulator
MKHDNEPDETISTADAARIVGVSPQYLARIDHILRPDHDARGHRLYSRKKIEHYAMLRATAIAARGN